jgi:hypothetical protein
MIPIPLFFREAPIVIHSTTDYFRGRYLGIEAVVANTSPTAEDLPKGCFHFLSVWFIRLGAISLLHSRKPVALLGHRRRREAAELVF